MQVNRRNVLVLTNNNERDKLGFWLYVINSFLFIQGKENEEEDDNIQRDYSSGYI